MPYAIKSEESKYVSEIELRVREDEGAFKTFLNTYFTSHSLLAAQFDREIDAAKIAEALNAFGRGEYEVCEIKEPHP